LDRERGSTIEAVIVAV